MIILFEFSMQTPYKYLLGYTKKKEVGLNSNKNCIKSLLAIRLYTHTL